MSRQNISEEDKAELKSLIENLQNEKRALWEKCISYSSFRFFSSYWEKKWEQKSIKIRALENIGEDPQKALYYINNAEVMSGTFSTRTASLIKSICRNLPRTANQEKRFEEPTREQTTERRKAQVSPAHAAWLKEREEAARKAKREQSPPRYQERNRYYF